MPPELKFRSDSAPATSWNIVLYGPPGSGKSTAAAGAPGRVMFLNMDGPGALRFARTRASAIDEVQWDGPETLDAMYLNLRSGAGKWKTVVVDPISELYESLLDSFAGGGKPGIQHHGDTLAKVRGFVRAVRDLDVNVVLVCHEQVMEDDDSGSVIRMPLTGGKKLPHILTAAADVVAYCAPVSKDGAPTAWMAQLISGHGRYGKDRSGLLGNVRPLDIGEWITTMNAPAKGAGKVAA